MVLDPIRPVLRAGRTWPTGRAYSTTTTMLAMDITRFSGFFMDRRPMMMAKTPASLMSERTSGFKESSSLIHLAPPPLGSAAVEAGHIPDLIIAVLRNRLSPEGTIAQFKIIAPEIAFWNPFSEKSRENYYDLFFEMKFPASPLSKRMEAVGFPRKYRLPRHAKTAPGTGPEAVGNKGVITCRGRCAQAGCTGWAAEPDPRSCPAGAG